MPSAAAEWAAREARAIGDALLPYRRLILNALFNPGDAGAAASAADSLRARSPGDGADLLGVDLDDHIRSRDT
jgi:hypothetical protein